MYKYITYIGLFFTLLLSFFSYQYKLPATEPVTVPQLEVKHKQLLLPLDSRPVCTRLPQQLGALAGTELIVPPKKLLDNYENKALRPELVNYLQNTLPQVDEAFISTDLMIHGGLLASRQFTDDNIYEKQLFTAISQLQNNNPAKKLTLFSTVPRLLVSDQLIPDRWYKYYLFRYSQYYDIYATTKDGFAINYLGEYARKIPLEILSKYLELYNRNEALGKRLIKEANPSLHLLIGQDDSSTYGLPQVVTRKLQKAAEEKKNLIAFTQGADETGALLVAKSYLQQTGYRPKLYLIYADPSIKNLTMPYQSKTCQELIEDKCRLLDINITESINRADFLLYINCGHDTYQPTEKQAQELTQLLHSKFPVALLDLTANFEKNELLMPLLIKNGSPLSRLTAFAGWNTFSNSLGSLLAQSSIITGQAKILHNEEQLLALYAANSQFNTERILEDYCYQKLLHSQLSWEINTMGYDSSHMYYTILKYAEQRTNSFLRLQADRILHNCLGKEPFYKNYYLRDITVNCSFPWCRSFEVQLQVETKIGRGK